MAQLPELLAVDPETLAHGGGQLGDAVLMLVEIRVALGKRAQQHGAALAPGRLAARVLVAVHRGVGLAERLGQVGGLVRDHDRPERRRDREPLAVFGQRRAARPAPAPAAFLHRR